MKQAVLLLSGVCLVAVLLDGSYLRAQSVSMSLTAPGTNNVMQIKVQANTSLLGNSSDTKPFSMTGGYTVNLDSTYDDSRTPTLNNLEFQLDTPGNILMNNTGGNFHLKWLGGLVNEYASTTTLRTTPMSPSGPEPVASQTSFDMMYHGFQINGGTISWWGVSSANSPWDCTANPIDLIPTSSSPSTIQVARTADTWTSSSYSTYVNMPISFPSTQLTSGSISGLGTYTVFMSGSGTVEANGTFTQSFAPTAAYWDTSLTAGLQAGSGTWGSSVQRWSVSSAGAATLLGWYPGGSNLDVFFNPSGTSTVTVAENVSARSLTFNGTGYTIDNGSGAALTLAGGTITANCAATINAPLAGTNGLTKTGPAKLTLGGGNAYFGQTTVVAGTLELGPAAQYVALSLGGADIQSGKMIFDYVPDSDPAATIRSLLIASYDGGRWDIGQFRNSTVASTGLTLGWLDDPVTHSVTVMATYPGDFNLDGVVNAADMSIIRSNIGGPGNWAMGDVNYDGVINLVDWNAWKACLGLAPLESASEGGNSAGAIPEPGTLALLTAAFLGLLACARRWQEHKI
jgi:autotransporter-associated beta strand protein